MDGSYSLRRIAQLVDCAAFSSASAVLVAWLAGCGGAAGGAPESATPEQGPGPTATVPATAPAAAGSTEPASEDDTPPTDPRTGKNPVELKPEGRGAGFGLSKERSINVCMPPGERRYLASLRCPDGSAPEFHRVGSIGPRAEGAGGFDPKMMDPNYRLPPGTVDTHIIDLYEVTCADGTQVEVFMDMYHCADPDPVRAVGPLKP